MRAGLDPFLDALDGLIHREIVRLRTRYQLSLDEFRGLFVSDEQVDALLAGATHAESDPAYGDWRAAVVALARGHPQVARLAGLGLTVEALGVLLAAAAPDLDPRYDPLFAYLNDDAGRRQATESLLLRLLADDAATRQAIRRTLLPGALLLVTGLLRPAVAPDGMAGRGGLFPHPGIVPLLHGLGFHDGVIAPALSRLSAESGGIVPPALLLDHSLLVRRAHAAEARAVAVAPSRTLSARAVALGLCAHWGTTLAVLDLARLPRETQREAIRRSVLQAALDGTPLLIEGRAWSGEPANDSDFGTLPDLLAATGAMVLLDIGEGPPPVTAGLTIPVAAPSLDPSARLAVWRGTLARHGITGAEDDLLDVARRFRLGPETIDAVARSLADRGGAATRDALFATVRSASDTGLVRLAKRLNPRQGVEGLVLPADTRARIRGLIDALANQHRVMNEWGFERATGASGLRALFAGPPGTGKTMAAGAIARELGLDCYRIDLSQLVSKYIGETEKNLERIFRGAEAANAILFFDEADALFGKRSEVKDAQDRFANIETAFLLQRIEYFDGIIFLATNISRNIDAAFARRMQFVIDFPAPGVIEREALWRAAFPAAAPLAADVDFDFLAHRFDFAGGDIRNVALDAAFLAAQSDGAIGMAHLIQAVARELVKQGRSPSVTDFRQYYALLEPLESAA